MRKKIACFALLFLLCMPAYVQAASEHPYMVTVNATKNIVTVYEQDEAGNYTVPKKAFVCSTGEETPAGTFRTTDKYTWRLLFGDVYGQYATRIYKHILFHSVPYFEEDPGTLEYEEYNKLGTQASAGCIRLTVEDAKWIYDNCPKGTTVKIVGDGKEPLQPEKPKKIDATDTLRRGWDPTDHRAENPWKTGDFRKLTVAETNQELKAFYKKGTYFLSVQDTEQILEILGMKLELPTEVAGATEGTAVVKNGENTYTVQYHAENGMYYKLRDLANAAGAGLTWDSVNMQIVLDNGVDSVVLQQNG